MTRVYVTGIGVVSSIGMGRDAFWSALCGGSQGISEVERFDTSRLDRHRAGEIKNFHPQDHLTAAEQRHVGRCSAFALAAARQATQDAGLSEDALAGPRTAVVMGTTMGEANLLGELQRQWIHEGEDAIDTKRLPHYGTTLVAVHVARAFGTRGVVQTLPAACAAGNYAIGYASDLIRSGQADVAITGASEVIEKLQFEGFARLGAMSPDRCRPFDLERQGLLLGEGAGMLILESEEHLSASHRTPLAEVGGFGLACDAHHITRPRPDGEGSEVAMRDALALSGSDPAAIGPADVDFVNAHGTGTASNDPVETSVITSMFGERAVPVSSIKSMLGHCMGAASAIEAVSCVLSIETGMLPPTVNYATPDPECNVDLVANRARQAEVQIALNNSLAFGGCDAVVCFAAPGRLS